MVDLKEIRAERDVFARIADGDVDPEWVREEMASARDCVDTLLAEIERLRAQERRDCALCADAMGGCDEHATPNEGHNGE